MPKPVSTINVVLQSLGLFGRKVEPCQCDAISLSGMEMLATESLGETLQPPDVFVMENRNSQSVFAWVGHGGLPNGWQLPPRKRGPAEAYRLSHDGRRNDLWEQLTTLDFIPTKASNHRDVAEKLLRTIPFMNVTDENLNSLTRAVATILTEDELQSLEKLDGDALFEEFHRILVPASNPKLIPMSLIKRASFAGHYIAVLKYCANGRIITTVDAWKELRGFLMDKKVGELQDLFVPKEELSPLTFWQMLYRLSKSGIALSLPVFPRLTDAEKLYIHNQLRQYLDRENGSDLKLNADVLTNLFTTADVLLISSIKEGGRPAIIAKLLHLDEPDKQWRGELDARYRASKFDLLSGISKVIQIFRWMYFDSPTLIKSADIVTMREVLIAQATPSWLSYILNSRFRDPPGDEEREFVELNLWNITGIVFGRTLVRKLQDLPTADVWNTDKNMSDKTDLHTDIILEELNNAFAYTYGFPLTRDQIAAVRALLYTIPSRTIETMSNMSPYLILLTALKLGLIHPKIIVSDMADTIYRRTKDSSTPFGFLGGIGPLGGMGRHMLID